MKGYCLHATQTEQLPKSQPTYTTQMSSKSHQTVAGVIVNSIHT